jgi:hypothetical protein
MIGKDEAVAVEELVSIESNSVTTILLMSLLEKVQNHIDIR